MREFDANHNFIKTDASIKNSTFITANNCRYIVWCSYAADNVTNYVNGDICINISDPTRNGEYEPYWMQERAIDTAAYFPDGMKSVGSVYDELTATKAVKRVGVVVIDGTQPAGYGTHTNDMPYVSFQVAGVSNTTIPTVDSGTYTPSTWSNQDKRVYIPSANNIVFTNSDFTGLEQARAMFAANPVTMVYELLEPVETDTSPELNLTYKVSDFGTEEIIHTDETAPPILQIQYGVSVIDALNDSIVYSAGLNDRLNNLSDNTGQLEPPYTEVEWVESNGTQYVYLGWKPPIATWGFEADFIIKNAFSTTAGAWNQNTNINGYGSVFGTRNSSMTNDVQLTTYTTAGTLR